MKSFKAATGWLFPLVGGPNGHQVLRLPSTDCRGKTTQEIVDALPETVTFGDGAVVYRMQLATYQSGKNKGTVKRATGRPKEKVPAYEYVYVEPLGDFL